MFLGELTVRKCKCMCSYFQKVMQPNPQGALHDESSWWNGPSSWKLLPIIHCFFRSLVRIHTIKVLKQSLDAAVFDLISLIPKLSNYAINRKQVLHQLSSTSITVNVTRSLKSYQKYFMTELSSPLTQASYGSLKQVDTSPYLVFSDRLTPLRQANTTQEINATQANTIKTNKKHSCKLILHTNDSTMALTAFCACRNAVSMSQIHNMAGGDISLYSHGWPNTLLTRLMLTIGEVCSEIFLWNVFVVAMEFTKTAVAVSRAK